MHIILLKGVNMNREKISVVVPVYNAEAYLEKCLNSILGQTYENLEIILVNDGSTDRSAEIIENYKNKDPRIVVINKENGGVSSARNRGIDVATGKFIIFVDADDYIENNMFETLEEDLFKNNVDISMCGYRNVDVNGNILYESKPMDEKYFDAATFKRYLFKSDYFRDHIWNKLFRLEIIKEHNIRFNEDIHIKENVLFLLDFSKYAFRYSFGNEMLYNFLYNPNGQIHSKFMHMNLQLLKFGDMPVRVTLRQTALT